MKFRIYLLSITVGLMIGASSNAQSLPEDRTPAEDQAAGKLLRGKTFQSWMLQVSEGAQVEDRELALQILRNEGLRLDREQTLSVFTQALSSAEPTVQSLAAAGLKKAGLPTDSQAVKGLVRILSEDLSDARPAVVSPSSTNISPSHLRFTMILRVIGALEVLGEQKHAQLLEKIGRDPDVHGVIRQAAQSAVRKIKLRLSKKEAKEKTAKGRKQKEEADQQRRSDSF